MNELNLIKEIGAQPTYDYQVKTDANLFEFIRLDNLCTLNIRSLIFEFTPTFDMDTTSPVTAIIGNGRNPAARNALFVYHRGNLAGATLGSLYFLGFSSTGSFVLAVPPTATILTANTKYTIAIVVDDVANSITMSLDGVVITSGAWSDSYLPQNTVYDYNFSRTAESTNNIANASYDNIRGYTDTRTLAEVTILPYLSDPNLRFYFPISEGTGNFINDVVNSHQGQLYSNGDVNSMWIPGLIGTTTGIGIEKSRLDLFENQFVSVTKQSFDINNLKQRLSGVTNNFTLPFTANNSKVLDFLDLNGNISNKPYQLNYVEYIQDGTPIIEKGRLNIREISDDRFKVDITHGINDFFDRIRDKYLHEPFALRQDKIVSMFAVNQLWSNDSVVQDSEGVVIPLVDYGFTNPIPEYQQSPFIIIKKAFEFIAKDVDYLFIDSTSGKLDDLLFGPNKLYEDVGELKELFSSNVLNGGDSVLLSTFYTTKKGQIFREYSTSNTSISGSPIIQMTMFADGILINSYTLPSGVTDYNVFQTFPIFYEIGTKIEIYVSNIGGVGTVGSFEIGEITTGQNSSFGVGGNPNIFYENIFPTTQVDFVKYVFELFNLGMEVNPLNKTIEIYKLNDVYNPNLGNTIDLSDYYSNVITKKFDSDFGKVNSFKYQYKEGNEPIYDSSISANNINKEKDLITSDLTGCFFDRSIQLGSAYPYLLTVDGYDSANFDSSSKEIGYRVVKQIKTPSVSVLYRNRNIPFGTFSQFGQQTITSFDGLDWSSLIEDNYSSLRDYVLNRYQEVKVLMRVPRHLIDSFSFKNKIFIAQLNSKFVVQSIKTGPDGLSEWVLIKLN